MVKDRWIRCLVRNSTTNKLIVASVSWILVSIVFVRLCSADWPQFRGLDGQGHADGECPEVWSDTQNIRWKTAIPGRGWSSPVVANNQIWITTATDDHTVRALCIRTDTGQIILDVELFNIPEQVAHHPKNGFASCTPVIQDGRVFMHFGALGTACVSTGGDVFWRNSSLKYSQPYGGASSPVIFGSLLILCCDGVDDQFVVGLDVNSGHEVWRQSRQRFGDQVSGEATSDLPLMAYSTPLLINDEGEPQLICAAAGHVAAYDPRTGAPLWWFRMDSFSLVARPVYGAGVVYVAGFEQRTRPVLFAIPVNKRGEIPEDELKWTIRTNVCHVPSPLLINNSAIFMISDSGIATYSDAATGELIWRRRIGGNYSASPIVADGRLLVLSEEGDATILAADNQFRQIARNTLDGAFQASPAVSVGCVFLRSDTHLYCIDDRESEPAFNNIAKPE